MLIAFRNNFVLTDVIKKKNAKQDKQCAYNVTLRRVRATTVAVERQ